MSEQQGFNDGQDAPAVQYDPMVVAKAVREAVISAAISADLIENNIAVIHPLMDHIDLTAIIATLPCRDPQKSTGQKWRPATDAPRDGTVVLLSTKCGDRVGFYSWRYNKWCQEVRFTSTDPEGNFSVPTCDLTKFVFIVQALPEGV